ncbi:nuclear transport factor 2 family protein [Sphingomonas oryzagri]
MIALAALALASAQAVTLAQAAQAFDDAQQHHDRAALEAMLAPDFLLITGKGAEADRYAFIKASTDPGEKLEPFVITRRRVLPLGADGGVASGDGIERGTQNGKPFVSHFRYADVFARRGGRWLVVYTQVTALPAP